MCIATFESGLLQHLSMLPSVEPNLPTSNRAAKQAHNLMHRKRFIWAFNIYECCSQHFLQCCNTEIQQTSQKG